MREGICTLTIKYH